ncbi:MAG TPA: hypothetical protein VN108_01095, partial [Marmoricola sp.]|nr:hypothetical protein [Marmoricola sp.]
ITRRSVYADAPDQPLLAGTDPLEDALPTGLEALINEFGQVEQLPDLVMRAAGRQCAIANPPIELEVAVGAAVQVVDIPSEELGMPAIVLVVVDDVIAAYVVETWLAAARPSLAMTARRSLKVWARTSSRAGALGSVWSDQSCA